MKILLKKLDACQAALAWVGDKTPEQAWNECERGGWLLWLAARMIGKKGWPTHEQIVLAACACAETVLPIFEKEFPDAKRPRNAIETAKKWARGKATIDEVKNAASAAAAANAAAASAAAAANDAAYAAYAAEKENQLETAKIVRKMLKVDFNCNE